MRRGIRSTCFVLSVSACLAAASGCATSNLLRMDKLAFWNHNKLVTADSRNPVADILCIWQPSEGRDPQGVPSRGFGGQILFMTHGSSEPCAVEGDVRIYVFDDQGAREEQIKPIHQYDFTADVWKQHLRMGTLGPSYQVFVPYPRKGFHQARCSLRIRFKPTQGPAIYSSMAEVILPGPEGKEQKSSPVAKKAVAEADEEDAEVTSAEVQESDSQTEKKAASKTTQERNFKRPSNKMQVASFQTNPNGDPKKPIAIKRPVVKPVQVAEAMIEDDAESNDVIQANHEVTAAKRSAKSPTSDATTENGKPPRRFKLAATAVSEESMSESGDGESGHEIADAGANANAADQTETHSHPLSALD